MLKPLVVAALLCTWVSACATPSGLEQASARPEKVYRTGSNLPVRDATPDRVESAKVDPTAPAAPMPHPGAGR